MEDVRLGKAGWVRYEATDCPPTYLRYLPNERGRWVLRELMIDSSEGPALTANILRSLPLPDLEALVNEKTSSEYLAATVRAISPVNGPPGESGSNIAILASHYTKTYGTRGGHPIVDHWCQAAQWSTVEPEFASENGVTLPPAVRKVRPDKRRQETDWSYRLTEHPDAGLTDEFLGNVARAYYAAIARGESPNRTIGEDLGFHPGPRGRFATVERWVYEARKRGIMQPARKRGARG